MQPWWIPALLLLSLPAAAQEPCSQAASCPIALDVADDELQIAGQAEHTVTAGDWFHFDAFSTADGAHEIHIPDLGISFTVEPFSESMHGPYLFDAPGSYVVQDINSGQEVTLHVVYEDVATQAPGGEESPAPAALLALVAAVWLMGRR